METITTFTNTQQQHHQKQQDNKPQKDLVLFASQSKMSPNLIELRIDNHLNRIMKNHRLINFCNAIKNLPVQSRIFEKLLEIINSCEGLIERKMPLIKEANDVLLQIRKIHKQIDKLDDFESKDKMMTMEMFDRIKQVSIATEQIIWALNSNKEHLRYIARVMVIPEIYFRIDGRKNPDESILLRSQLVMAVEQCEHIIEICRFIRLAITSLIKDIYSEVNFGRNNTSGDNNIIPLKQH